MDECQMKINLTDIFPTYVPEVNSLTQELPNYKIEAKLRLEIDINLVFDDLESDLKGYDMKLLCVDRNNIIVTGIPPDDSFNLQKVLEMVQRHDRGAEMTSFTDHEP